MSLTVSPSTLPARDAPDPRAISGLERTVVAVTGLNLALLGWAFGGVDVGSQLPGACLGALALGLALRTGPAGAAHRRLRAFPVFWAGLALFGYILVQAANPAFAYRHAGHEWWLEAVPHVAWLPAGMAVPFADAGPLRGLLLWFTPWATTCALWVALTHRTTCLTLLNVIAANGFLLAAFGLVQLAAGQGDVFGVRHVESAEIFASFIYRNHAAAYFYLVATATAALAWQRLSRRRHGGAPRPGLAILLLLFTVTALAAVALTFSLGGLLLLAATWAALGLATGAQLFQPLRRARISWPALLVAGLTLLLVATLAGFTGRAAVGERIRVKLEGGAGQSARLRWLAARQGFAMLADRPLLGWGAGCFRYGFTKYQRAELELTGTGLVRHFWEHVHNDWLEGLIEFGIVGALPLAVMLGFWVRQLTRVRVWRQPFLLWGAGAVAGLGLYGWFDFPAQNPAVLLTAACVLCAVVRWGELAGAGPLLKLASACQSPLIDTTSQQAAQLASRSRLDS